MRYISSTHNRSKRPRLLDLWEYFFDNFWFKAADLENQKICSASRSAASRMWSSSDRTSFGRGNG